MDRSTKYILHSRSQNYKKQSAWFSCASTRKLVTKCDKKEGKKEKGLPKNWEETWKAYWEKRSHQRGGFLNRYDFSYAGRDVVNQAGKIAPEIIKQATGEIDKKAQN